ncbi:hypothetical protein ACR3K2_00110 [Cryptosporidium serpentis]
MIDPASAFCVGVYFLGVGVVSSVLYIPISLMQAMESYRLNEVNKDDTQDLDQLSIDNTYCVGKTSGLLKRKVLCSVVSNKRKGDILEDQIKPYVLRYPLVLVEDHLGQCSKGNFSDKDAIEDSISESTCLSASSVESASSCSTMEPSPPITLSSSDFVMDDLSLALDIATIPEDPRNVAWFRM